MNIDDIMNENIEDVVRVAVMERVHLPKSELEAETAPKKVAPKKAVPAPEEPPVSPAEADVTEAPVDEAAVDTHADEGSEADCPAGAEAVRDVPSVDDLDDDDLADDIDDDDLADEVSDDGSLAGDDPGEDDLADEDSGDDDLADEDSDDNLDDEDLDDDDDDDEATEEEIYAARARKREQDKRYESEKYDPDEYVDDEAGPESCDDEYDPEEFFKVKKAPKKYGMKGFLGDAIFLVAAMAVIVLFFYIFPPYIVDGPSMEKTLSDRAFGFGCRFDTPDRGDIVIVNTGDRATGTDGAYFIKRVIGIPGDTIRCVYEEYDYDVTLSDGSVVVAGGKVYRVYRNGELLDEPYVWFGGNSIAREVEEVTLGKDEYFIMGDNRFNSNDSRAFGPVKKSDIKCTMIVFLHGKHNP